MIMRMAVPWILGAVLIVFPFAAYPLGLGTLEVKSALNEPLYAEIDFTSITEDELKGLNVSLAPRADFDAVGAERLPFLSQIKFTVAQRADGRYYVQLRTDGPIAEPFLHVLLQLEWVGGRLVREYTALIDPPSYVAGRPPAIESPETAPPLVRTSPFVETVPPPARADGGLGPQVVPPPVRDPLATRPGDPPSQLAPREVVISPSPVERPGRQPAARAAAPARPLDWANFSEYRVRPGDTLWHIAERVRADTGLSLHQVMLAIFRNNPDAFFRDNVNNLYAGKVLAIPERDQIESMSVAAARREFRAQYDVWQEYKLKLAAGSRALKVADSTPAPSAPAPAASKPAAQAELQKGKAAAAAKPAETKPPEELLKIVRAAPSAEKAAAGEKSAEAESARAPATTERSALAERATTLDESLASKQLETRELSEKVGQVQSQIKNEQRLIEIENQALAQQTGKPAPPKPEAAKPETAKPAPPKPETKTEAAPAAKPAAGAVKSETAPVKPKPAPVKPPQAAPRKPAPAAPPPPPEKGFLASLLDDFTSLLDDFLSGSLLPLLGGAVVIAGAGILMLYMRRRRRSIAEFEESILASDAIATTDAGLATAETSGQATSSGDTSFLSEFSKGGMGQVHTDEVDPIAEAEVYLAYGRDETAEEILKEAVAKNPERHELKQKLLEIYHQRNDVNAFETLAEELYAAIGGRGDDLWTKVEEMGRKLNPANPMFLGGAPERRASAAASDRSAMPAVTDTGLQASMVAAAAGGADGGLAMSDGQAGSATPSIDFNFDLDTPVARTPPPADNVLDFDLSAADLTAPATEKADAGGNRSEADDDLASLQFDMPADNVIEFDGGKGGAAATAEPTEADTAPAGGDDDIKWEIDGSLAATADAGDGSGNGADAHWDETATKLDLAKAYIDMGDNEGARSILDEVLAEGNEQQKKQAADLAAQIA